MSVGNRVAFNMEWTKDKSFKAWLKPSPESKYKAFCSFCSKTFDLSNMGVTAVKSHARGTKHKENEKFHKKEENIESYFLPKDNVPNNLVTATSNLQEIREASHSTLQNKTQSQNILSFLPKDDVTKAEIIWALAVVYHHISINTGAHCVEAIKIMMKSFNEDFSKKIHLGKDKLAYMIYYGLAPYFAKNAVNKILSSDTYAVSFDECFNKITKKEQMDFHVRFWNKNVQQVETKYLGSAFLTHTKASDLLFEFKNQVKALNMDNLTQISMDGPNVNFKFLEDFQKDLIKDTDNKFKLFQIGSCGLHTIHNAFKRGFVASQWEISDFLTAIYYLFNHSSGRRADYLKYTGSNGPHKFCSTRWVENLIAAAKAEREHDSLQKYKNEIENTKDKTKAAVKTNKNFITMAQHLNDKLLKAKLAFFSTIAGEVEIFLKEFQDDKPMMDLQILLKNLLERFVKQDVILNESNYWKIDLNNEENLLKLGKINVGHKTRAALSNSKGLGQENHEKFQRGCRIILKSIVNKILEKSPLKYPLVRYLTFCDPALILDNKTQYSSLDQSIKCIC